jgi:uncharacterized protein YraI
MPLKVKSFALLTAATVPLVARAAPARAEDVWVKSQSVDIRTGKGAVYPILSTVKSGTQLDVVAHEGKWLKVQVGDQQGYVFQDAVADHWISGVGNMLANLSPSNDSSSLSTSAAAKGLSEEADQYAKDRKLDPAAMNRLVDFRKQIDPHDWEQFTAEGKVGPDAPQPPVYPQSPQSPASP